jgi:carbon-monoxide dehydrogenase medium subunit
MGTIGGNLCLGDPLTDPGACLMALDAEVALTSAKGKRTVRLDEFFIDYYETALELGEILTEIHVPPPDKSLSWAHIKFTPRTEEDFATIGVTLVLKTRNGHCEDVRLVLSSSAPTIFRAKKAEEIIRGKEISEELLNEMGKVAAAEADPIDDMRGTPEYKRELIRVLVPRAAQQAAEKFK